MTNNNDNIVLLFFFSFWSYTPIVQFSLSIFHCPLSLVNNATLFHSTKSEYYVFTSQREQGPSRSSSVELFAIAVSFWQSQTPGEFEYMLQKFRYEGGALGITSPVFLTSSYSYWEKDCSSSPCAVSNTFSREARTSFQLVLAFWWEYFTSLKENILS